MRKNNNYLNKRLYYYKLYNQIMKFLITNDMIQINNDNSIQAVAFAKNWLTKRDNPQTVHDENWDRFAQILAECSRDYLESLNKRKSLTRKQKDHERYMRNRENRRKKQKEYYAQHREYFKNYKRKKLAEETEKLLKR